MTQRVSGGAARLAFASSLAVAIGALWWARLRYWYPHDEGTLAQAALRVMHGAVPHRDFGHPYTGADAVLHMVLFRLFEPSLAVIRTGLAALGSVWIVAMAWWFRRHVPEALAAVAVLVCGAWSIAAYPAAVPSWYVTMLVTGAVAILLPGRAVMPGTRRLVIAGAFLGLALTFKVTALYAVVGVVAWLASRGETEHQRARAWVVLAMLAALAAAILLLAPTATPRTLVHLLLPPAAVAGWVVAREVRRWWRAGATLGLGDLAAPVSLTLGVALGAAPAVAWLAVTGALGPLVSSVGDAGGLRADFASMPPPPLGAVLVAVPLVGLIAAATLPRPPRAWLVALIAGVVFTLAWNDYVYHRMVWQALRGAVPLGIVGAMAFAWRNPDRPRPWFLPVAVLGWMVLSQFPFAAAVYFLYLAPLMLMAVATTGPLSPAGRRVIATLGVALAAFGYAQVVPSSPSVLGRNRLPPPALAWLPGERGGLLVPVEDSLVVHGVVAVLTDSVRPGPIWAGPDSPEVAFLAGRDDLNPAFFEFLAVPNGADPTTGAVALVVRRDPPFSPPPTPGQLAEWERRFLRQAAIGPYTVLWEPRACDDC